MKKIFLLLACASMMATSAMAQVSVVKEVAKLVNSGKPEDLGQAMMKIMPALENPETKDNAETWYLAGKAAFGLYDQMSIMKQMSEGQGQESPVPAEQLAEVLMGGFEFMQTALPLDSVKEKNKDGSLKLDKNGNPKVKTKYSNEIADILASHISDVLTFAGDCVNNQKYETAAQAYTNFFDLLDTSFAHKANINLSPEDFAQTKFFQGFSQYYAKDFLNCYKNVSLALAGGYTENNAAVYKSSALANIIQEKVDAKDFAGAYAFIDEAIGAEPNSSLLYDMKGFIVEQDKGNEQALPLYKKAVQLDANNADANYNVGRLLYNKANDLILANPDATTVQMVPMLQPIYEEALPYLRKAAEIDETKASQVKYITDDIDYKYEQMGLKK
ncbi:MAG: hypothetical protein IKR25_07820 [Muribaculaceae bacterium]|nr:hypothetical protein [Muribaculaceae bacterium]